MKMFSRIVAVTPVQVQPASAAQLPLLWWMDDFLKFVAIEELALCIECCSIEEFENQVVYLPI